MKTEFLAIVPVLPSLNIDRDVQWYINNLGFALIQKNAHYAVIKRESLIVHLQWHADTEGDPLLGGSVIKIFVKNIHPIFEELVEKRTMSSYKLQLKTAWNTNEFGCFDLNKNAIFFVESL